MTEDVGNGEIPRLEREIDIEIKKLTFYSEQTDDLIQEKGFFFLSLFKVGTISSYAYSS